MGDRIMKTKLDLGKSVNGLLFSSMHDSLTYSLYKSLRCSVNRPTWLAINNSLRWDIEL